MLVGRFGRRGVGVQIGMGKGIYVEMLITGRREGDQEKGERDW